VPLTFTAHLLPLRRGILATCYARLAREIRGGRRRPFSHIYASEPFVELAGGADEVSSRRWSHQPMQVGFSAGAPIPAAWWSSADRQPGQGAAGQAVQN